MPKKARKNPAVKDLKADKARIKGGFLDLSQVYGSSGFAARPDATAKVTRG